MTTALGIAAVTATLRPGDTATFKAGIPTGHCLQNHGTTEARYLVIGTRSPSDVVTYPDHNNVLPPHTQPGNAALHRCPGPPGRLALLPPRLIAKRPQEPRHFGRARQPYPRLALRHPVPKPLQPRA